MVQTYKDLIVWQANQKCILKFSELINLLPETIQSRNISDQLFRSISSIGANIAEGHESFEGKEYLRYINIALRSAVESDHWLTTLKNMFSGQKNNIEVIENLNIEVIKMLKGLRKSIENKRKIQP